MRRVSCFAKVAQLYCVRFRYVYGERSFKTFSLKHAEVRVSIGVTYKVQLYSCNRYRMIL